MFPCNSAGSDNSNSHPFAHSSTCCQVDVDQRANQAAILHRLYGQENAPF
jgi:hypothetical protein